MMKFQFTTVEQSKELLELGVPMNSADCYAYNFWRNGYGFHEYNIAPQNNKAWWEGHNNARYTPVWSAGRLIEIYEFCIGDSYSRHTNNSIIDDLISDFYIHIQEMDLKKLEDILC